MSCDKCVAVTFSIDDASNNRWTRAAEEWLTAVSDSSQLEWIRVAASTPAFDGLRQTQMKLWFKPILLFLIVAFGAATVYPCTCEIWKPEKKLRKARAVFVGEVVAIGPNDKDRFATVSIKFKVDRYWKGIKEPHITVVSAPGICCTCGLAVSVGLKYLIYAFKTEDDQIETSLCMSAPLDAERSQDELRVLGKGKILKTRPATNAAEQIVGREAVRAVK